MYFVFATSKMSIRKWLDCWIIAVVCYCCHWSHVSDRLSRPHASNRVIREVMLLQDRGEAILIKDWEGTWIVKKCFFVFFYSLSKNYMHFKTVLWYCMYLYRLDRFSLDWFKHLFMCQFSWLGKVPQAVLLAQNCWLEVNGCTMIVDRWALLTAPSGGVFAGADANSLCSWKSNHTVQLKPHS